MENIQSNLKHYSDFKTIYKNNPSNPAKKILKKIYKCEYCGTTYDLKEGHPKKCWICECPYFIKIEENGI
jgi:rubrerythrin